MDRNSDHRILNTASSIRVRRTSSRRTLKRRTPASETSFPVADMRPKTTKAPSRSRGVWSDLTPSGCNQRNGEWAEVQYLCTGVYNRDGESDIHWQDPDVGVEWPVTDPVLSPKDNTAQTLRQWLALPESDHFVFSPGE